MTQTTNKTLAAALLSMGRLDHVNLASNKTTEALRSKVKPGSHKGKARFELEYDLTVGEDYDGEVAQSVPWKRFAGALLAKLNPATREAAVRELLTTGGEFDESKGSDDAEALIQQIMGKTTKRISGKITGTTTLTPLD